MGREEQAISVERDRDVIAAVVKWSEDFIEQPHEIFGGLPVCPFARAARLKETIRFEVRSFEMDDALDEGGHLFITPRPTGSKRSLLSIPTARNACKISKRSSNASTCAWPAEIFGSFRLSRRTLRATSASAMSTPADRRFRAFRCSAASF